MSLEFSVPQAAKADVLMSDNEHQITAEKGLSASPWARVWDRHEVINLASSRLAHCYAGEKPDEVLDSKMFHVGAENGCISALHIGIDVVLSPGHRRISLSGAIPPQAEAVGSDIRLTVQQHRFEAATLMISNGQVFLPNSAPWLETYLKELLAFPNGKHDDQVDSSSQFLYEATWLLRLAKQGQNPRSAKPDNVEDWGGNVRFYPIGPRRLFRYS